MSQPDLADFEAEPGDFAASPSDFVEEPAGDMGAEPVGDAPMPAAAAAEVPTQKQKTNVYTVMLFISLVALCVGVGVLMAEVERWGAYPWWNTSEATPTTSS